MICKKLHDEDASYCDFKMDYEYCYAAHKCIIEDIKKDCNKARNDLKVNTGMFQMVLKQDPDIEDLPFGKVLAKFLGEQEANVKKSLD
jgi:hypothetical protein